MAWAANSAQTTSSSPDPRLGAVAPGLCLFDPAAARVVPPVGEAPPLFFLVEEGRQINAFYRQGPVAAHIVLDSGPAPRLIVAFPAGNSGVGLWFGDQTADAAWNAPEKVEPVSIKAEDGGKLHGVTAELSIDNAPSLTVRQSLLGSVRTLRNYKDKGEGPEALIAATEIEASSVTWRRERLDGAAGYRLSVEVLNGTVTGGEEVSFKKTGKGPLRLRITALSGDPPLTPILKDAILKTHAADNEQARNALAFLSYEEKLLAGSWRFNTYFGRDTLMSLYLLMPVLQPRVVEAGLGSVLNRLDENGEVAHEEDIGEFAILRRKAEENPGGAGHACKALHGTEAKASGTEPASAPICDYKMIDDDFMLAPAVASYLLDTPEGARRAEAFLNQSTIDGEPYRDALLRNFEFVLDRAAPFAKRPDVKHLIALRSGESVGEWRDSEHGLGGGRIPYNVNAVFVPAALHAIARLADSGLLDAKGSQAAGLDRAAWLADIWTKEAPRFFTVSITSAAARNAVRAYAGAVGVDPKDALASLPREPLRFNALSLHASGEPVPILNSDGGFALLFLDPPREEVERSVRAMMRPFPAGLLTDVGLLVANPAFADRPLQPKFNNQQYHGTVIWSWQQAVLAAGLARQLRRTDLPPVTRTLLCAAEAHLWRAIEAGREMQASELWSWSFTEGGYRVEPFGQHPGDQTESNAAQLWSTVFLAVAPTAWKSIVRSTGEVRTNGDERRQDKPQAVPRAHVSSRKIRKNPRRAMPAGCHAVSTRTETA
jgi:hypothetical protein